MKKHFLLYGFAAVIISLTLFDIAGPKKTYSDLENRKLKQQPSFSLKSYADGTFTEKYEEYVNDQFIFRDSWIDLKSRTEYLLCKIENNGIIYGGDNYLFNKFSQIDEERLKTNTEALYSFIRKNSDKAKVMMVPSSYQVYEELLPYSSPVIDQEEMIDLIYSGLNSDNCVPILDLMEEHSEEYIYYRTDHHWTTYGAYLAYLAYMESIGVQPEAEYNELITADNFYGTYFSKSKKFNAVADELAVCEADDITMKIENEVYDSLYDYSWLDKRDKYSVFLRGNNALTVIKNNELNNGKKLLLFKDSYGNSIAPFLASDFEEIHVVDLRAFMQDIEQYIDENDFDNILVLYSFVNFSEDTNIVKLK